MRNNNEINKVSSNVKPDPQTIEEVGQPLTHRQLKHRRMKNRRKEKEFNRITSELSKSHVELESLQSKRGKKRGKKIRALKSKIRDLEEKRVRIMFSTNSMTGNSIPQNPPSKQKKIAELDEKIHKAKGKAKKKLIHLRNRLDVGPRIGVEPILFSKAFNNAYRSYKINRMSKIDVNVFFTNIMNTLENLICKETTREAVGIQITTWIKFAKEDDTIDLGFNSKMMVAYRLNDINELVRDMISQTLQQIENPALRDSWVYSRRGSFN